MRIVRLASSFGTALLFLAALSQAQPLRERPVDRSGASMSAEDAALERELNKYDPRPSVVRLDGAVEANAAVVSADEVSSGVFGATAGGGFFYFMDRLGIGTLSPAGLFHVVNGGQFFETNLDNAAVRGFNYLKSRGTPGAKAVVQHHDSTGYFIFYAWDGSKYVASAMIRGIIDGPAGLDDMPGRIVFATTADGAANLTERMRITSAGTVGIGTTSPSALYKLHVVGNAFVNGTLTGTNIQAQYQDIAEWVHSKEDLAPGAVVVLDSGRTDGVTLSRKAYDTHVAGVVSERPGLTLGIEGSGKEMVATTGRVRVRVDASSRPIRIGDLLVTSDKPGTAMRSTPVVIEGREFHQPGTILGKALENLDRGEGEILVLLSMQ